MKLFDDFYVVPSFQREYVWQTSHVDQLLGDIYAEFGADDLPEVFQGFQDCRYHHVLTRYRPRHGRS